MNKLTALAIVCGVVCAESSALANATITLTTTPLLSDKDPVAVSGAGYSNPAVPTLTGSASAASDLRTGTVRVASQGSASISGSGNYGAPNATAAFSDSITVSGPGTTVDITVTLDADGIVSGSAYEAPDSGGLSSETAGSELGVGSTTKSVVVVHNLGIDLSGIVSEAYSVNVTPNGDPDITVGNPQLIGASPHIVIHATVKVGMPTVVGASVSTFSQFSPGFSATIDYGNTARISISVPDGYTWTSASGVLLTNAGGVGLTLPPDGGAGVHGDDTVGGDAGQTNGDASTANDAGNADAGNGSTSSGGCDVGVGGLGASGGAIWALCVTLLSLRTRRTARRDA